MSELEIRLTTVDEVIPQSDELFAKHYEESAKNKHLMVLAPNVELYKFMEGQGLTMTIGAFIDGKLVGYSVNFLTNHLHYKHLHYANNDILYVDNLHRNSRIGLRLIKETERLAKERGAKMMLWHAKENTPLALLLPKLNYGIQDIIFSKEL